MQQRFRRGLACLAVIALCAPAAFAGDKPAAQGGMPEMTPEMKAMMEAWMKAGTPGQEHQQLATMVGDWNATVKTWMGPGEPNVSMATAHREMILDGRVLAETFNGEMMGTKFVGHGMLGYDNASKKFWSTWNDSMSTGIMVSWGSWDDKEKGVVYEGSMTDPQTGQPFKVRSIGRQIDATHESFEMWEEHGGQMMKTLEITMVKK
jgi:hypothetical protein